MKIKPKQYAIALYEAVHDAPKEKVGAVLASFVRILVKNNALRMAPQIIDYFRKFANRAEGIADLKVSSAEPIKENSLEEIKKSAPILLGKKFKKINITEKVDPALLGGFVLEAEDTVFDASVKNKFRVLKNHLFIK